MFDQIIYSVCYKYVPLHHIGVHRIALRAGMKPAPTHLRIATHSEQKYDNYDRRLPACLIVTTLKFPFVRLSAGQCQEMNRCEI